MSDILIFTHVDYCPPAHLETFLARHGETFREIRCDQGELASVAKGDAPDATTLVLTPKKPDATLLAQLSDRAGMTLSPKTFSDDVAAVGRKPVCSGPYKFVERIQNDRIVLEKFDQYYDAKDFAFKRVTFLPIPDTTVRLSNLRAGDLDMLERLNPSDVPQVRNFNPIGAKYVMVPANAFELRAIEPGSIVRNQVAADLFKVRGFKTRHATEYDRALDIVPVRRHGGALPRPDKRCAQNPATVHASCPSFHRQDGILHDAACDCVCRFGKSPAITAPFAVLIEEWDQ